MNVMLTAKGAVHATTRAGLPACNTGRTGKPMQSTERAVTCKRCLKVLADREDAAARVAYYAGLRDGQDETLGQAAPIAIEPTEAPRRAAPAADCTCAAQYLGHHFHTDPCPLNDAPAAIEPTEGPVCCVCGTAPDYKLYENYRGQLFCVPCADGEQADTIEPTEAPAASEPPAGVVTVVVDGITWWAKLAKDPAGKAFVWYATPTTVQWFQCNRRSPAGSVTRAIWDAVQAARNA